MLERVQDTITVDSIMVERGDLLTWQPNGNRAEVQRTARENEYNQVPVIDGQDILGLTVLEPPDRELPASDAYEPITPEWLVSADTSIRRLIDILDSAQHPARFVFQEDRIVGMVTYADLNRAVARTALYLLISRLEIKLADLLRDAQTDSWGFVRHLSTKRRGEFEKLHKKMEEKDVAHDPIEHFNLSDVMKAVRNEQDLLGQLGYPSKSQFKKATSGINSMRHDIAHSVRMVVNDVDSVAEINRRCGRIESMLDRFRSS